MIEQGINVVVGLDLGDQYSHVCVLDLEGHIIERVRVRTHVQAFETYFGESPHFISVALRSAATAPRSATEMK